MLASLPPMQRASDLDEVKVFARQLGDNESKRLAD